MKTSYDPIVKLRLSSKKLESGNFQVKFHATLLPCKSLYGYLLAKPKTSLKDVVLRIEENLQHWREPDQAHHYDLSHIGKRDEEEQRVLIFEN